MTNWKMVDNISGAIEGCISGDIITVILKEEISMNMKSKARGFSSVDVFDLYKKWYLLTPLQNIDIVRRLLY